MSAKKLNKEYEVKKKFSEKQVLAAKTPEEYIDRTLNSDLERGRKTLLCRQWRKLTGYSIEDVQHARNRHPYWKQKKMNGWRERNEKRWAEHNYNEKTVRSQPFTEEQISRFLELNRKDRNGSYLMRDWEVARELNVTIPAVQHWRRKYLIVIRLLEAEAKKPTRRILLDYLGNHENGLRERLREFNGQTVKNVRRAK